MQLIFIYGPPAAGKLTVATELSSITKFKLFHNHLTVDLGKELFDFGTPEFYAYIDKLRYEFIQLAAKNNIDLIFTYCYAYKKDDAFVKKIIKLVKKYKGHIHFVHLHANKDELAKRVVAPSREKFGKIKKRKMLSKVLKKEEFYKSIPFVHSLDIDNTSKSPKLVSKLIKKKCSL